MADVSKIADGLSEAQRRAMMADRSRGQCAYTMRVRLETLEALRARGLLRRNAGVGSMFSPRTSIEWPLTNLGFNVRTELQRRESGG